MRPAIALLFAVLSLAAPLASRRAIANPEIPGKPQGRPIAIVGGMVHTVSGATIDGGVVVFDKGKITAVGKGAPIPADAERVDAKGKHVYPGLVAANATVGLVEIDSIRATVDHTEAGLINPNVKAQVAVNPDSEMIPVTRSNGILTIQASPRGGLLQGQSALMTLDGWTWEDMTIVSPLAVHMSWPNMSPVSSWWVEDTPKEQIDSRNKQLVVMRQAFEDARAYWTAKKGNPKLTIDLRWEAMIPLFERKLPLFVRADESQEIQAAVAFAAKENLRIVIVGGYDAPECAALLKERGVSVIINSVNRSPIRRSDAYDAAFTVAERLRAAGVKFCICDGGKFEASGLRNLPYEAAAAAAYGLPPDEALKAITLYPAEILGVADRAGSLDVGKDASLLITDGDILEIASHVESAYIQGRAVDLNNRQKRLFEKYQEKQRRDGAAGK